MNTPERKPASTSRDWNAAEKIVAELGRLRTRAAELESGRETEQTMLRNAASRIAELEALRDRYLDERSHWFNELRTDECQRCNYDTHVCPGCGAGLPHGVGVCHACDNDIRDGVMG